MYDNTQALLKTKGITEIVLHRGMGKHEALQKEVLSNAMQSWSTSESVAEGFGQVQSAVVPITRVLSTPFTGFGCLKEEEFVLVGG